MIMFKRFFELYPVKTTRSLEIAIPLLSYTLITLPIWLSLIEPLYAAYFLIFFNIYWLYKSAQLGINALKSYGKLKIALQTDWLGKAKILPNYDLVQHVVIVPTYKESLGILKNTFDNLIKQDFPHDKILIVIATEARDPGGLQNGEKIKNEYEKNFREIMVTSHPDIPHEVKGKSSNMAYAGEQIVSVLKARGENIDFFTVTSCDADALLHPFYLSYLSYEFLRDEDRSFHFYQAAVMFYANFWRIPLPMRVMNTVGSLWSFAKLGIEGRLINFSTYSLSLKTVDEVGYWGKDVVPEDYHLFFKTFFHKGQKVKTLPLYIPVMADGAESTSFFKTFVNHYEQNKRWAWGVSDDPWIIRNFFLHPEISFWSKFTKILHVVEDHILWPTNWFLITLGGNIPALVNPNFSRTIIGRNLSDVSSAILTVTIVFILMIVFVDSKMKPPRPASFPKWKIPFLYLQWLSLPVVSFVLATIPGLDAHTRLLLGKRLEYRVTEKVEK
jgi:cellulose synthase/poly-beta-1,6-N-acetylglucosamine synthase-like glycosyltransferase